MIDNSYTTRDDITSYVFADEDKVGPIVLASMLGIAIIFNFVLNLFDIAK